MSESPQAPRRIEYVPLDGITRAERNPKAHDQEMVIRSIRRFGFVDAVVHDGRTGRIIAGHGRLEALQAMRAAGETAPEGVVSTAGGAWLMPVQYGWASRSDHEAEALLVVLNKATEAGGWNNLELSELLADLRTDPDPELLTLSGFSGSDLDKMLRDIGGLGDDFTPEEEEERLDERDEMECPNCHQMIKVGVKVRGVGKRKARAAEQNGGSERL